MSQVQTTRINKSKLLLVEGEDEVNLFTGLLTDIGLSDDFQIISAQGKDKFPQYLKVVKQSPGFDNLVASIGIIRDADDNPENAFRSVCSALRGAQLPEPTALLRPIAGPPKVAVLIVPDANTPGMIETVCLNSVSEDPAMICVDQYFECLQAHHHELAQNAVPKARVRAFLASREWLEIAHFEYLQKRGDEEPLSPTSSATVVPRAHAFLASRYTPNLSLGVAAKDGYWRFEHPAFDGIKQFLQML